MRSSRLLGVFAVALCAALVGGLEACGSSDNGSGSNGVPNPATDSGSGSDTRAAGDSGGSDSTPVGDTGATGLPPACPASVKDGTLASFNDPASTTKAAALDGIHVNVVATSPKFLASKSKTTLKCLYAVFVADANATFAPYSGVLVVSQGNNATTTASGGTSCSDGDLIPKDVKPGDMLDVTGVYDPFGPKAGTCAAATPPSPDPMPGKMIQLSKVCKLTKTGTGTVPTPAEVTVAAVQSGGADLAKWQGGLVVVKDVSAAGATDKYGAFDLTGSTLKVTDKIYFRGAGTGPVVATGDHFTQIVGESFLDFCNWSNAPRSLDDFAPKPTGADGGAGDGGSDTGDAGDTRD